jgi:hypothetical protein
MNEHAKGITGSYHATFHLEAAGLAGGWNGLLKTVTATILVAIPCRAMAKEPRRALS